MKKDLLYYMQQVQKNVQSFFRGNEKKEDTRESHGIRQQDDEEAGPVQYYGDWQQKIRDAVISRLPDIVRKESTYPEKLLKVYIDDIGLFIQAKDNALDTYLDDSIVEYKNFRFYNLSLCQGTPPVGMMQAKVNSRVCITVERKETKQEKKDETVKIPSKAVITVLSGQCVLKDGSVELIGNNEQTWNIGFGEFSDFGGRIVRRNQIALQYAKPEGRENEPYPVSRAHAHILYKPGKGFIFLVDPRGESQRTAVQKGEKIYKLTNRKASIKLDDDDIIILNREMLLFKTIY